VGLFAYDSSASNPNVVDFDNVLISSFTTQPTGINEGMELTDLPVNFQLFQNYPNPFNPVTTIRYQLPKRSKVTIKIIDKLGREVKTLVNAAKGPGEYQLDWNGTNNEGIFISSGLYFYSLNTGDYSDVKKMILLK